MIDRSSDRFPRIGTYHTINSSGPVLGVFGADWVGKTHGFTQVVAVDMGGTGLDIGIILDSVLIIV